MEPGLLVIVGLVFFVAGAVKGVSGMGLPTVAMALLGMVVPPITAAALMVLPSLATNISQCAGPHARQLAGRLWPLWLALVLATALSPLPDLSASGPVTRLALGIVLTVYGLSGWLGSKLPGVGRHGLIIGCLAGALTGLLTATTGVFVMPMVPYLQSLGLAREELIQALGLSFTVATLALMVRLGQSGVGAAVVDAGAVCIALLTAFLGLAAGTRLRHRLQPRAFQLTIYGVLLLLGLAMIVRSV